jgi:hypothetical protein
MGDWAQREMARHRARMPRGDEMFHATCIALRGLFGKPNKIALHYMQHSTPFLRGQCRMERRNGALRASF